MLKKAVAILKSRELIALVGVVLLSLLVWLLGPLIAIADYHFLENALVRFAVILVLFVLWALLLLRTRARDRRKNEELVTSLVAAPPPGQAGASDEVPALKERFQEALALLRKSKLGGESRRQYLYQLPWYIIIGPPGAGKTTALVNSGLNFPLADQLGKNAVRGVGGTRNCDWWFTDEAILIDTAGRYTTQDSNQLADSAAWSGFLDLLRSNRPRQPINGVLLAISLLDLATLSEKERYAHARAIKQRIGEIRDRLGVRFPVYVLFTKADLFAGFVEFFDDLGREDRQQIWGVTFPFDEKSEGGGTAALFGEEFDALMTRLEDRLLARLQQETDIVRRKLIFGFPQQVASLKHAAEDFLNEIFRPSRLEETPMLRGVYLTSGTQFGTPIDRLMGIIASTFGLARQTLSGFSGAGRSYFITRLLKDVVFAEAGIVSTNRRVERRNLWIRRAAYALSAAIVFGMGALWLSSFYGNMALIESVEASVAKYSEEIRGVTLTSFDDSDLKTVLPPLGTLRGMPTGYAERDTPAPLRLNFGLYQGDKLGFQALDAYRRALNGLLLPRILGGLERDLRANLARPDYLYEALKIYLMLGRKGPLDIAFVKQWMVLQWANAYPAPGEQPMREALEQHLTALLATPLSEVPLDTGLIQRTRQILLQTPLAARAYSLIVHGPDAGKLQEWNALNAGGAETDRVFVRRSGRPLTEGIPGIYTVEGFHRVVLLDLKGIAREVAKESWVLGAANEHKPTLEETAKLEKDVLSLYMTDYAGKWDALLGDLAIVPLGSLGQTVEVLNILSGPASPLRRLLVEISRQTTLSKTPGVLPTTAADTAKVAAKEGITEAQSAAKTLEAQSATAARLANIVGANPQATPLPGKEIDDRYKALHDLVAGTPSGLDRVITMLSALYTAMATDGAQAVMPLVPTGPAAQLAAEAGRLPAPLRSWTEAVVQGNSSVTVKGARERINAAWKSNVLPFCQKALDNRYPMVRGSSADVTIDDFSRLFSPGGLIDAFFDSELKSFVNTTERSWRWQRVENVGVGSSNEALLQFQRAAAIRDSLFAGAKAPHIRFTVTPLSLDPGATQVLLSIDGQALSYKHGPPIATQLQWPGTTGVAEARVAFSATAADAASPSLPLSITLSGPWSLFRLLDKATVTRSTLSEKMTVAFALGGHSASFELDANSVVNPFMLDALERFRCPPSL